MFVHTVYFWLHNDIPQADVARFAEGLRSLTTIESVRFGHFGTPAATDRPIIDRTYSYALVVAFEDEAGHDAYQVDPVHDRVRETLSSCWVDIKIYDFISRSA